MVDARSVSVLYGAALAGRFSETSRSWMSTRASAPSWPAAVDSDLNELEHCAVPPWAPVAGHFRETMAMVAETLGFALPGVRPCRP